MHRISMTLISEKLSELGIATLIDSTGGGVMCLYVGTPDAEGVYPAQAGPGSVEQDGVLGLAGDFYAGPDEWTEGAAEQARMFDDDATEQDVIDFLVALPGVRD